MTDYLCMTPQELEEWRRAAANPRSPAQAPCVDCPIEFHLAEKAAGRCDRNRQPKGGAPRRSANTWLGGRGKKYATDEERIAARRQSWRESSARARARARVYADSDEYSVPIAHNAQRPSARLYSGSEGVDIPEYRRNG